MPGSLEDVSLLSDVGTMVFSGHCEAFPDNSWKMQQYVLQIWKYVGADECNHQLLTIGPCAIGIGGNFGTTFGGGDATLGVGDTTGMAVNVSTRLGYLGITMDEMSAMGMLFGDGDDVITGLLEVNDAGTEFGVANFLGMDSAAAMTAYGMDQATYVSVYNWAASWFGDVTSLPMILLGGSGDMTASLFVNTTFGAEDPLNGGYLANSLNLGGGWAALGASGGNAVDLDPALSGNALYGPLGLTTSTGSAIFLYGELSGFTPPT